MKQLYSTYIKLSLQCFFFLRGKITFYLQDNQSCCISRERGERNLFLSIFHCSRWGVGFFQRMEYYPPAAFLSSGHIRCIKFCTIVLYKSGQYTVLYCPLGDCVQQHALLDHSLLCIFLFLCNHSYPFLHTQKLGKTNKFYSIKAVPCQFKNLFF